jgi:RNA polymerase sigma-70 factor (ECF subfamily)
MTAESDFHDEIIRPIEETMIACIWRVTQSREDARDALQEALSLIWRRRRRIRRHPKPHALVLKICRDKAIDCLRKSICRNEREMPLTTVRPAETELDGRTPRTELFRREAVDEIRKAIARLPRKQAQAVVMRVVEEQPYADIALALGCSEATARSHVRHGRDQLQRRLQGLSVGASS